MKRHRFSSWILLVLALLALGACGELGEEDTREARPTVNAQSATVDALSADSANAALVSPRSARVIVKFRKRASLDERAMVRAGWVSTKLGAKVRHGRALGTMTQSMHSDELTTDRLIRALKTLPEVEWAVEDQRRTIRAIPNDPLFARAASSASGVAAGQWFLQSPSSATPAAIDAQRAWSRELGNPGVVVAVLDTGVLSDHPDLSSNLRPGYDFVSDLSAAADGNRRDMNPYDPGDATSRGECGFWDPPSGSSWHGTQVAGLIAASTDNGIGVASVGRNITVLPVRVLGKCGGYDSDIIAGMLWAGGLSSDVGIGRTVNYPNAYPARVINLSLGTQGSCSSAYVDVIDQLSQNGIVVVAAAGNDTGFPVASPANCPGAIAVAGIRHTGTKVGYSNIGPEVTLAAPAGNCVNLEGPCLYPLVTTTNAGRTAPTTNTYSDSENISVGTSFAAPLVAATVALMLSANPELNPSDVKSILSRTARPFPKTGAEDGVEACKQPSSVEQLECYCTANTCGAGYLNTFDAVSFAADLAEIRSPYRPQAELYFAETNRLQIARVDVGTTSYFNVSVSIDQVIGLGVQAPVASALTRYDPATGFLHIGEVMSGKNRLYNVSVTVKEVLQVGVP